MDVLLTIFLIRKPFPCQSVADPVRFGYVLGDICWCGSIKDERDATRTSRMGLQTIRTLTDELRMRYGRAMDTNVCMDFPEKSSMFDFPLWPRLTDEPGCQNNMYSYKTFASFKKHNVHIGKGSYPICQHLNIDCCCLLDYSFCISALFSIHWQYFKEYCFGFKLFHVLNFESLRIMSRYVCLVL